MYICCKIIFLFFVYEKHVWSWININNLILHLDAIFLFPF
jgi:hypothetical protein